MKKIVLVFVTILMTTISHSQTWKYKSGGNAFDGKYKTANIKGEATDYPYHNPVLVINLFNEESLNFYISGAGYYSSSDIEVLWVFNNESDSLYKTESLSISDNGKIIFLTSFTNTNTSNYLTDLEFIEKLKSASKVDVRIKNDYEKNDISFSLSGSTRAIDYVISKKYREKKIAYKNELKKIAKENVDRKVKRITKILNLLTKAGVIIDEYMDVYKKIETDFDLFNLNIDDIDSLYFDVKRYSIELNLFDSDKKLLRELKSLDSYISESFKEKKKEIEVKAKQKEDKAKKEKEKEREVLREKLSNLLNIYEFTDKEKRVVLDKIYSHLKISFLYVLRRTDSVRIYKLTSYKNEINFMTKEGEVNFSVSCHNEIPDRIIEKIEKERKESFSKVILEFIKKYNFTDEENQDIISRAIIIIDIYFKKDISILEGIDISVSEYNSKEIIVEYLKTDGSSKIDSPRIYKSIAKKIKKNKKQRN